MDNILYIISPLTKEIIPYYFSEDDTFEIIIRDLISKNKPSNLIFYDGLETGLIKGDDLIFPFLMEKQSQILFFAYDEDPQLSTFPQRSDILMLLLKWDLSEIIPFHISFNTTLRDVLEYIFDNYRLVVTLTKFESGSSTDLTDSTKTIKKLLPLRTHQILLLMNEQPQLEQFTSLGPLPAEVITHILLNLPVPDILTICQVSNALSDFCLKDTLLWKPLLLRDFGLAYKEEETWREEYEFQVRENVNQILNDAAKIGDLKMVKYALHHEISTDKANTYNEALKSAIGMGHINIINFLINKMNENDLDVYYPMVLTKAIRADRINILRLLVNKIEEGISYIKYHYYLNKAARGGNLEIVTFLLDLMTKEEIESNYYGALEDSAKSGSIEVTKKILTSLNVIPTATLSEVRLLQQFAARGGNEDIINLIIQTFLNPEAELFNDSDDSFSAVNYDIILLGAIEGNHIELVNKILDFTEDYNIEFDLGDAWYTVGGSGNKEILELFFGLGFDFDVRVLNGAVENKHPELVERILRFINENNIDIEYEEYLREALDNEDPVITKLILDQMREKGVELDYEDILEGETNSTEIIAVIFDEIEGKEDILELDSWIIRAIYLAARKGRLDLIEQGLRMVENFDINITYGQFLSKILAHAASGRHLEIMKLIFKKARKRGSDLQYQMIVEGAAKSGSKKLVRDLIEEMKKKNITIDYEFILYRAADSGHLNLVKMIIEMMEDINLIPDYNHLLMKLAQSEYTEILELILNKAKEARIRLDYKEGFLRAGHNYNDGRIKILEILLREMKMNNLRLGESSYSNLLRTVEIKGYKRAAMLLRSNKEDLVE